MDDEMKGKLKELIVKNSPLAGQDVDVGDETDLIRDLHYDSLSFVKLIVDIEGAFQIEIPDEDIEFDTIGKAENLARCIKELMK